MTISGTHEPAWQTSGEQQSALLVQAPQLPPAVQAWLPQSRQLVQVVCGGPQSFPAARIAAS